MSELTDETHLIQKRTPLDNCHCSNPSLCVGFSLWSGPWRSTQAHREAYRGYWRCLGENLDL